MLFDNTSLKEWFVAEKRDLPWRNGTDPYAVWISEVMLQQTQVAVVIPYFERWMKRFPTIQHLADASLDQVIKEWEGLGYYSRARNLHAGAQYVLEVHQGILPQTAAELIKIKGLGEYTVGAILSFAFHKRAAAVDGNVIRVLCRYFRVEEDIAKPKTVTEIRKIALELLSEEESWIVNEGLIELGATICTRNPKCGICPLKATCKGFLGGVASELPIKSKKIKVEQLYRSVAVIQSEGHILVKRGEAGKIMSDLHEFPYLEVAKEEMNADFESVTGLKLKVDRILDEVNHSFTRFKVNLRPVLMKCEEKSDVEGYQWCEVGRLRELAFSSGHRRVLGQIEG